MIQTKDLPAPDDRYPIRRALLSVSDKTGLAEFGRRLAALGVELVSTGGQPGGSLPAERILYPGPEATGNAVFTITWADGTVQEVDARRNRWTVVTQE